MGGPGNFSRATALAPDRTFGGLPMAPRIRALAVAVTSLSGLFAAGCASQSRDSAPYSLTGRDITAQRSSDDLDARREAARGNYYRAAPPSTNDRS